MNKFAKIGMLTIAVLLVASPAWAAGAPAPVPGPEGFSVYLGVAIGTGLIVIGAAYGIGKLGTAAVESMARQPEVARNIQMAMIIAAALIEGFTFFGLVVCLLKVLNNFMG